jgi:hypothetical protein
MLILGRKNHEPFMSALGHKRTFGPFIAMSALPPKADIHPRQLDFRFVPKADIRPLWCRRGHHIETAWLALPLGAFSALGEAQKSESAGTHARGRRGLGTVKKKRPPEGGLGIYHY